MHTKISMVGKIRKFKKRQKISANLIRLQAAVVDGLEIVLDVYDVS